MKASDEEDVQRVFESLLEETWQTSGWTVSRALTWRDVAASIGVDQSLVTSRPAPPCTIALDQLGENLERSFCCAILSVRTDKGWEDRAIDFSLPGFLINGPALTDQLLAVAGLGELRSAFLRRKEDDLAEVVGDWIDEFGAVDLSAKTLRLSLPEYEEQWSSFLEEAWPGWTVWIEPGGASEHFAHTGRAVPADFVPSPKPPTPDPPNRSYDECVRIIREHLGGNEARKSADRASHEVYSNAE